MNSNDNKGVVSIHYTDFVNKNLMGVGKKDHERVKICFLAMKSKLIIIL